MAGIRNDYDIPGLSYPASYGMKELCRLIITEMPFTSVLLAIPSACIIRYP